MLSVSAMLGIDSCAVEGFEVDKIDTILKDNFNIDTDIWGVSVMAGFGYRINKQPNKTRQNIKDITMWF